jgi:hypothetical protein
MKNEWHKFDPKDSNTHPRDNTRVQVRYANGTQFSGGYLKGYFRQGGVISANTVSLTKHWRYAD